MTSTIVQNNHIHKKNKQEVLLVDGSGGPEIGNSSFFFIKLWKEYLYQMKSLN